MGHNYRFELHPPEPAPEAIRNSQDFDALLALHQKNEATRRKRRFRVIAGASITLAAAAVAWLVFNLPAISLPDPEAAKQQAIAYFSQQPVLQAPLKNVQKTYRRHTIDASAGGAFELGSGSRLVVPSMAFQDNRGRAITGVVDIYYREMHDAVDFFLAGIPLSYDSAGFRRQLESGGMLEILGQQNGQPIAMAPGKSFTIEMTSTLNQENQKAPLDFNLYYFDTLSHNWRYRNGNAAQWLAPSEFTGLGSPELQIQLNAIEQEAENARRQFELDNPAPKQPLKPFQPDAKRPTLELDLLNGQLAIEPDSRAIVNQLPKGTIWQIAPNCPPYDERAFQVNWERVRLKLKQAQEYELTLIAGKTQLTLLVQPVLLGRDFDLAMASYREASKEYESAHQVWKQQQEAFLAELDKKTQAQRKLALTQSTASGQEPADVVAARPVKFVFLIDQFGLWTCSRPIPDLPQSIQATAFVDQDGRDFPKQTAFMAETGVNTLYQVYASPGSIIPYSPEADYLLWMVSANDRIALAKGKLFRKARSGKNQKMDLKVNIQPQPVHSETDLREMLGL